MVPAVQLTLYSAVIFVGAIGGALVPLLVTLEHRLTTFLAFAAGIMFGAAFFHMLPEAFHAGRYAAFTFAPVGFFVLFVLERYVLVHVCEEPPDCEEHSLGGAMGLTAFLGLSLHTLFDGIALASATWEGVGAMAFVAIAAHKVPSSLSLAAILKAEGKSKGRILLYAALFGLMVPLGAGLYLGVQSILSIESVAPKALAFSAGSFLYIAVSDLLPHVNRHGKDRRWPNVAAMLGGLASMYVLAQISPHVH
jgi:zinc and cadmium transporter